MTNLLESFRVLLPYLWRLRPHAAIPIALAFASGLPLAGELFGQWDFPALRSVEHVQARMSLYKIALQILVVAALARWARQLIAFPLYSAGWLRTVGALLFYWGVVAIAFLGPDLAINRSLQAMHRDFPDARAAQQHLDTLQALCDVELESDPSPDMLEIFRRWYGPGAEALGVEMVYLTAMYGYQLRDGLSDDWYSGQDLSRFLRHCKHEHSEEIYEIEEFQAWVIDIDGKDLRESFLITSDLIGGLAVVVALAEHAESGRGPFAGHSPASFRYFGVCLFAALALLIVTERIGRGSFRIGHVAERLLNSLPVPALDFLAKRTVDKSPVLWSLGLPRMLSDVVILSCAAILVTVVLDQLHHPAIFTDDEGRMRDTIQAPFPLSLILFLAIALLLLGVREPIERTRFSSFPKNCLYTTLAVIHFSLVWSAGLLAVLLTHEAWSQLHGQSSISYMVQELGVNTQLDALMIIMPIAFLAATTRMSCLAGGFRMGASTLMIFPIGFYLFAMLVDALQRLPSSYQTSALLGGVAGVVLLLWLYPAQRKLNPWVHGAFVGVLALGCPVLLGSAAVLYDDQINGILKYWFEDPGPSPIPSRRAFDDYITLVGTWLPVVATLATWSYGLRRVSRAFDTPE